MLCLVPSGELTFGHGKSLFLMGKLTINGHVQLQTVSSPEGRFFFWHFFFINQPSRRPCCVLHVPGSAQKRRWDSDDRRSPLGGSRTRQASTEEWWRPKKRCNQQHWECLIPPSFIRSYSWFIRTWWRLFLFFYVFLSDVHWPFTISS